MDHVPCGDTAVTLHCSIELQNFLNSVTEDYERLFLA